jgi:putative transcriptional regulator
MESLSGQLLISAGGLYDTSFRHTVVLLGVHDADGAAGVILNRPMDVTVHAAIPTLAPLVNDTDPLFEGGPVEPDQAVLLVELDETAALDVPVFGSIGFLTGDVSPAVLAALRHARVLLGHAGWGPGQLEAELEAGAWLLEPARADDVFTAEPRSLWRRLLERMGPPHSTAARIPFDPRSN